MVGTAGTGNGLWAYTGLPWASGPGGGQRGEAMGKTPGRGPRARISGMSGEGVHPQSSPKGCLSCLLREKIAILGSSVLQVAASSDFQQMDWEIGLLGV